MSSQPLAGVRVLDLTHALAGPFCTMLLGDLGADVIKVESPGAGDHSRHWGPPFLGGESTYFLSVNRNKRSVVLDLKQEIGLAAARALATASDVVVENLRPGTADRLGVGFQDLSAGHPELIYCSISGFGRERGEPGYDQIVQGTSGVMSLTGRDGAQPTKFGLPIGDLGSGMFAAHAILAALYQRERTGVGRFIDIAMQDSLMALLTYQAGRYFATGEVPRAEGNFHSTIAPYGTFPTADGFLNLAVATDSQFRLFCGVLGEPELADDPRFAGNGRRQENRAELHGQIERLLGTRTNAEWQAALADAGIPAGPILDLGQVFSDPAVIARGIRVESEHPVAGAVSMVGTPWKLDGEQFQVRLAPPLLGQHTAEVLSQVAGYTDAEIERVVAPAPR